MARKPKTIQIDTGGSSVELDAKVHAAIVAEATRQAEKNAARKSRAKRRALTKLVVGMCGVLAWLTRKGHARRRPLTPVFIAVGLLMAGALCHAVPSGWRTALLFEVLAAVVTAGVLAWRAGHLDVGHLFQRQDDDTGRKPRQRTPRRKPRPNLRVLRWSVQAVHYLIAVEATASLWLLAAASLGPNHKPLPLLLFSATIAGGLPWWWKHRSKHVEPVAADNRRGIWLERIAGAGGVLAESLLADITDTTTGWAATILLPGGKLTTAQATSTDTRRRIASAYSLPLASVVVEPSIGGEEDRARLVVMSQRNPLRDVQVFTGPTLNRKTGWLENGIYPDGDTARWRMFTPDSGACHGFIAGTTGSGKSGLLNDLLAEYRHSGLAVTFLADPEDGESVPDWQDDVDYFAGTVTEIRRMLQGVERVMADRKARRKHTHWTDGKGRTRRGKGYHNPTREDPLIVVFIDESPDVLADRECRRIIGQIVKKGRKLGVAVILVTQVPSLNELGGDLTIRSMVSSTNVVLFRTSDAYSKQMAVPGELDVDPASLPAFWPDGSSTAGMGYMVAAGTMRLSPFRNKWVQDPYDWATSGEPATLTDRDLEAFGEDYLTWRERRDAETDETATPVVRPQQTAAVPLTKTIPASGVDQRTAAERILDYLGSVEEATRNMIAANTGISATHASNELAKLAKEGKVIALRHGYWAINLDADPTEDVISLEAARLTRT